MTERAQTMYRSASRADSGINSSAPRRTSDSKSNTSNMDDLSFLSAPRHRDTSRNRFFTPKAVKDLPMPDLPKEEEKSEAVYIKEFYKEFCAVVKRNFRRDNTVYLVDVLEELHFLDEESVRD